MKKAILPAIIAILMLAATSAHAQVSLQVHVGIPVPAIPVVRPILPPPPPSVVIRPRPVVVVRPRPVVVRPRPLVVAPVAVVHPVAVRPVRRVVVVR